MLNILTNCFFIIQPLLEYFKRLVQTDPIVACDDTGVTLLYPKVPPDFDLSDPKQRRMAEVFTEALENNKPSIRAKMWAYRGNSIKLNVFDFTVSRHRDGPDSFFANYQGTILGDCWHGFGAIAAESDGSIVRAACNSHARRKQQGENLGMPHSRPMPPIGARCHELRIRDENQNWRIMYRIDADAIVIVEIFAKKTGATPQKVIDKLAHDLMQHDLAKELGSSQSRVAKMEAADATVSMELLVRSLLLLGASRQEVGRIIGRKTAAPAA